MKTSSNLPSGACTSQGHGGEAGGDQTQDETALGRQRFMMFVRAIAPLAFLFALGSAVPAIHLHNARLGGSASILALYGCVSLWAGFLASRSRLETAALVLSYGLLLLILGLSTLVPFGYSSLTVTGIIAVALGLPYLRGTKLKYLLSATLLVIMVTLASGYFAPAPDIIGLPRWIQWTTDLTGAAAGSFLVLVLLWQFSNRLHETVRQEQEATRRSQRAQGDLRRAVSVRDDFLSVAGHELRSPLSALKLQLESLKRQIHREPDGHTIERAKERLGKAEAASVRLERLISELLDVSRITTGRLTLQPERTDLGERVREVVTNLSDAASRAGCTLRLEVRGATLGLWDPLRLSQVTTNLIENAIKFGRGKPIDVSVEGQDGWVTLKVIDYGIGVNDEDQQRIFQRFERAVSEKQYGGLGLGLWIVREIVEAGGGSIEVYSTPGQGASFVVKLPIQEPLRSIHAQDHSRR